MKKIDIFKFLQKSGKKIFLVADLKKILKIKKENSFFKQLKGLVLSGVLVKAARGLYRLPFGETSEFEMANALYQPSYVSLDSALSYYGIIVQTPRQIISVTSSRNKKINSEGKNYVYFHLAPRFYTGYQKINNFLMATPEKALVDALFFAALGRGLINFDELNLEIVNIKKLKKMASVIKNRAFWKLFRKIKK